MKSWTICGAAALFATVAQPVLASDYLVQPVPIGAESVRFVSGVPTLYLKGRSGAVQVTPMGLDHGNLVFGVAVYNDGPLPADFSGGDVSVMSAALPVRVLTADDLVAKAKSRAIWRSVLVGAIGGIAAGVSASRQDTYVTRGRIGNVSYGSVTRGPNVSGQIAAQNAALATGAGVAAIQARLDEAKAAIGEQSLQRTTVLPATGYAGRITLARFKPTALPQRVDIAVEWNGEHYGFAFQLAGKGTVAPVFPSRAGLAVAALPAPARIIPAVVAPTQPVPAFATAVVPVQAIAPVAPAAPRPIIASLATVAPGIAVARPVAVAAPNQTDAYSRALKAQLGVRGGYAPQGWTISD